MQMQGVIANEPRQRTPDEMRLTYLGSVSKSKPRVPNRPAGHNMLLAEGGLRRGLHDVADATSPVLGTSESGATLAEAAYSEAQIM